MKVLLVTLFLVAGAFARSAVPQNAVFAEGPACPIEDPLLRDGPLPLNITLDPVISIKEGSVVTNLIATGLSTLHYKIDLAILQITFDLNITRTSGNASYTAEGYLSTPDLPSIPNGDFVGSGFGSLAATGVRVKGSGGLFINVISNKVTLRTLTLDIVNFDSLELDLGQNLVIGGRTIDWAEFSRTIKGNFDREFAANKDAVTEQARLAATQILEQFTLAELIDIIGGGGDGGNC